MAEFALHRSKHEATFDVAPDLMAADVDEGQIGEVVTNLVMNRGVGTSSGLRAG